MLLYTVGRFMLKTLSFIYMLMALIGFLGYFQFEKLSSSVFSFFYEILGPYSIVLPIICVIFSVICWKIKISDSGDEDPKSTDIDDEDFIGKKGIKSNNQKYEWPKEQSGLTNCRAIINKENGFDSYFSGTLTIKDEGLSRQKDLSHLGTDFSSYFGQGIKNIYLPPRTINLHGFEEYFSEGDNFVIFEKRAANDNHLGNYRVLPEKRKNQLNSIQNQSFLKAERFNQEIKDRESPDYVNSSFTIKTVDYEHTEKRAEDGEEELTELFRQAGELIILHNFVSPSFLKRRLRIGYSTVTKLINMLEQEGVISKCEGNRPRSVLMDMEKFELKFKR